MISNIPLQRLFHQRISHSDLKSPAEVVAWMGGIQAQDYASAEWSIGVRLPGATSTTVEQAITDKKIVRTWTLRGTLHFVAAADVHWMLALLAPRMIAGNVRRYKELELDESTLARSNVILAEALQDGTQLSRARLLAILEQNDVSTQGQRGVFMLQRAALDGLICRGMMDGSNALYRALDVPSKTAKMAGDEALAEFARRYFTSHGPATFQDFVGWTGILTADARAGLEAVKSELVEEKIDDQTYYHPSSSSLPTSADAHVLPGFDEYVLGYKDRDAILDRQYANHIVPGGNGIFKPTIIIQGRIVGTWSRAFKKGVVVVTPHPFTQLTAAEQDAFAVAVQHYGRFHEMPVKLA
jgi:hypothetical protein